uniref:F-box domain-containing protein n=1 Tax=Panagrellus redivivus TaxID=6233 RepID=A0A7E4VBJ0_PANRE
MEFDPYPTPSRRPSFYHAKTEDDIIIDDVIPAKASKRPSSGQNLSSVKRLRTLDDHFNTSNVMTTPTSTRSLQHRSSVSSGISRASNRRRSATGSSSRHTTPTHLSSNVLLEISFIDPVSRLPIAKLVPMRCGHQTTINELCTGVQSLVVEDTYTEILPHRSDVPLNVDDTVGDALRGVIRKSFELNLHLVGWTPPVPTALFQRLGVAIPDAFSRYLAGFRSKHWSFSGFGCVSRVHFPRFLQGLALILSRVDVTTITIGPDALVKDDAKTDADPLKLNENVAKWLGILLRGKAEINIIGDSIEDAWLERISIQHDMSRHVDSLVLRQGRYSCRSVASFLQHCGSPVTLDLSFTELTACNEASWDTVVSEICNFSRLTTLRLAGTAVSTSQVQRILNVCPNIQKLNICNTSVDLSALKSDHITHLKATNMKTKPIDLTPVSRNFTKLIHLDVSLGTATIADALQHLGHRSILIVARFCQVGNVSNFDFTTLNAALLVNPLAKSTLIDAGFPDPKFSKITAADKVF